MHKEHVVEMVVSIIKETDLDPCVEKTTKDLGASCLLTFLGCVLFSNFLLYCRSLADGCLVFRHWCV